MTPSTACHPPGTEAVSGSASQPTVIVTGNPNVGKSVIFQLLTGRYTTVSNYPGTTVMVARGSASVDGRRLVVCDTPGLNSLQAASEDELVARDLLLGDHPTVVQVADAKNLARALTLTLELAEAGLPTVLDLNMIDEARERRVTIDVDRLGETLRIPVVSTIATQRWGLDRLRAALLKARAPVGRVRYPDVIEEAAAQMERLLPATLTARRALALLWLSGDRALIERLTALSKRARGQQGLPLAHPTAVLGDGGFLSDAPVGAPHPPHACAPTWGPRATRHPLPEDVSAEQRLTPHLTPDVVQRLHDIAREAQQRCSRPLGLLISHARLRHAHRLAAQVMTTAAVPRRAWLDRLGAMAMHPVWGVPILVAALWVMYLLVGDLAAQRAVGFLEETVFGQWIIPAFQWVVRASLPWAWAQGVLIGEYGLLTMALPYSFAIILPIVTMFFLCFGFIEDVGYLPRLAVVANRFCRLVGLNGKAVLPLVLGLGCDTMATMTTRILDSRRDRIITTLLLALGIPCSAQLGVIMAMLAGQPPAALGIWVGVVCLVTLIVGQAASRLIPGEGSPFLYELPPLRRPKLSNVLVKTLGRVEWYVKEAVPLFFLGTLVLFVLDALGALSVLERLASPLIVSWLGLPAKATGAFLVGFLRRDFGAAGLFALHRAGELDGVQTVVSLVTITLFVPCIAQYFMMVKERGWRMANLMAAFVLSTALLVGGLLWRVLRALGVAW